MTIILISTVALLKIIIFLFFISATRNIFTSFLWSRIGKILDPDDNPVVTDEEENALLQAEELKKDDTEKINNDVLPPIRELMEMEEDHSSSSSKHHSHQKPTFTEMMLNGVNDDVEDVGEGKSKFSLPTFDTTEISLVEHISVMVINARHGDQHEPLSDIESLTAFQWRSKTSTIVLVSCWLLTLIRIFQEPPWVFNSHRPLDQYFLASTPTLSAAATCGIKVGE